MKELRTKMGKVPRGPPQKKSRTLSAEIQKSNEIQKSTLKSRNPREIQKFNLKSEIWDLTANLLTEVCHEVITEPDLQPLSTETFSLSSTKTQDGARLDIAVNGFWGGRHERTFCDVRVFNPYAPSNSNCPLPNTYRRHEREKKNTYERRILEVEHASFTPLIFPASGGMASSTRVFYQRLASMLAIKWGNPYGPTMSWLNCRLVFSLLRSAIRCIRGARSSPGHPIRNSPIPLDTSEAELPMEHRN